MSIRKICLNVVLLVSVIMSCPVRVFAADDTGNQSSLIHEIHYYAKNYFREGKYAEAIKAYQKILIFSPEHEAFFK